MFKHGFSDDWSTLKKLLWLRVLQGAAAIIKTVTGTAPITLTNAISHAIVSLTQYGKCEQRNLPQGFTELDMTITDGASYIDTGIVPDVDDMEYDCVFYVPSASNVSLYLLQSRASSGASIYGITGSASGNKIYGAFSGENLVSDIYRQSQHTYHVNFKVKDGASTLLVEDLTAGTSDTKTGSYTYVAGSANTGLFANTATGYLAAAYGVKSAYIKKSGVLAFNYTACKDSNTAVGFYDSVSNSFVGATAGSLTAGSDTVPSPSTPMSVWCNNGRVVAGNCINSVPDGQGTFVTPSELTTTRIYKAFPTDLVVGRSYTVTVTGTDWSIIVQKKKPDDTDKTNVSGWVQTYDFTPEDGYIYGVAIQYAPGGTAVAITPADFNGTLTLDTTDGKPWSVGTPETLTVSGYGGNLFDGEFNSGWGIQGSDGTIVAAENRMSFYVPVTAGGKYAVTRSGVGTAGYFYYGTYADEPYRSSQPCVSYADMGVRTLSYMVTIPDGANYLAVFFGQGTSPDVTVKEVTTQTATVQNLFGVGDYTDEQEIIAGAQKHNVGILVLDGTEGYGASPAANVFQTTISTIDGITTKDTACLCTHYVGLAPKTQAAQMTDKTVKCGYNNASNKTKLYICDSNFADAGACRDYIAAQYAAGTPVIVIYPLATPTTETVTAQPLNTAQGTNVVEVTSEVDPVTMKAEYKATE